MVVKLSKTGLSFVFVCALGLLDGRHEIPPRRCASLGWLAAATLPLPAAGPIEVPLARPMLRSPFGILMMALVNLLALRARSSLRPYDASVTVAHLSGVSYGARMP